MLRNVMSVGARTPLLGLALMAMIVLPAANTTAAARRPAHSRAPLLDPQLFTELSSGIGLIRTFTCNGVEIGEGTGFLVGTSVVMTARHVVADACKVKVSIGGAWIAAKNWSDWHARGRKNAPAVDVATIRLDDSVSGHLFAIRTSSAAVGTNVAALGHPLGNQISLTQGRVVAKGHLNGIPILGLLLLSAVGSSGSPLVDNSGSVVGILQRGVSVNGTARVTLGIDLPSWWPSARSDLCKAYPSGDILGCGGTNPPPTTTTTPSPTGSAPYRVNACWVQYTEGTWQAVAQAAGLTAFGGADILARGPANYWAIIELAGRPKTQVSGVTVTLVEPSGKTFGTTDLPVWQTTDSEQSVTLEWQFTDSSYFFQHPDMTGGEDGWTLHWAFPDGETCNSEFSIF